jgi:hypothetical protein
VIIGRHVAILQKGSCFFFFNLGKIEAAKGTCLMSVVERHLGGFYPLGRKFCPLGAFFNGAAFEAAFFAPPKGGN